MSYATRPESERRDDAADILCEMVPAPEAVARHNRSGSSRPPGGFDLERAEASYVTHPLVAAVRRATDKTDTPHAEAVMAWALERVGAAEDGESEARHLALIATASPSLLLELWAEWSETHPSQLEQARREIRGVDSSLVDLTRVYGIDNTDLCHGLALASQQLCSALKKLEEMGR